MKKVFAFLFFMVTLSVSAQETNQVQTDTEQQLAFDRMALYQLQNDLYVAGNLIEKGGKLKNASIALTVVGGAVGGAGITYSVVKGNKDLALVSSAITVGFGLTALILNIVGNNKIKKGGRVLKNFQLTPNGVSITL